MADTEHRRGDVIPRRIRELGDTLPGTYRTESGITLATSASYPHGGSDTPEAAELSSTPRFLSMKAARKAQERARAAMKERRLLGLTASSAAP